MTHGYHLRRVTGIAGDLVPPIRGDRPSARIPGGCLRVHADSQEALVGLDAYPVPRALIIGKAVAVLWPPWRVGWLHRQEDNKRLLESSQKVCFPIFIVLWMV
jgi:hypothetical protein